MNRRGDIGFPNRSELWGRRIVRDQKGTIVKTGRQVDIKDPLYQGEVEFLKWNDPEGQLIICRYLKGYNTLDLLYQDTMLNASESLRDDTEASADANWIRLVSGDNVFDEQEVPLFVQYLRAHDFNESSISKSPNSNFHLYRDKKFDNVHTDGAKSLTSKFDALGIVNEAAKDTSLRKLMNLSNIQGSILSEDVKDEDLFAELQKVADEKPEQFLDNVKEYKKFVSSLFAKAKANSAVDFTKEGTVIITDNNKQKVVAKECPAKGDEIMEWILDDFLHEKAYEIAYQLKKVTDKIK
jgi:hypothetical protein